MIPDSLVEFGGEVKALDDAGRVGGFLVVFGSDEQTDLSSMKDYFTAETDFGRHVRGGLTDLLYYHDLPQIKGEANPLAGRVLGDGTLSIKDAGVWIEGQLALRDDYERKVFDAVKAGKMGWSSGTAPHRVRREKRPGGAHKVLAWPLGLDASITPTPAEPRASVVSLKSLSDSDPADPAESFVDTCIRTASGLDQAVKSFVKIGPSKRAAIKALVGSLQAALDASEPKADPDELRFLITRFNALEASING